MIYLGQVVAADSVKMLYLVARIHLAAPSAPVLKDNIAVDTTLWYWGSEVMRECKVDHSDHAFHIGPSEARAEGDSSFFLPLLVPFLFSSESEVPVPVP